MKKTLLYLLLGFFTFVNASAQKKWSLRECIEYAHENNLQVKRQKIAAETAKGMNEQSKFERLPNLNAGVNHNLSSGKSVNYDTYEYVNQTFQAGNLGIQSNFNIFNGFETYYRIKKSEFDLMARLEDVEKIKNDITLNIATAYLQILFNRELLEVAESQMEVTTLQVERTEKLVEVGNVARGELLEIQAQLANEKLNITNYKNELINSRITLIQLMDLDSISGFDIIVPTDLEATIDQSLYNVNQIYSEAIGFLPEVKSAEYNLKSAEKDVNVAQSGYMPSLSLRGTLSSRYSEIGKRPLDPDADYPYGEQISDNFYKQATLSLNIPIFNRFQVKNNVERARLDVMDSKLALEQTKLELYQIIQQAHADAIAAKEKYNATIEAVESYQEAFNYTEQKFNVGIVSSVDYNIAKNNLTRAKSEMLQAKFEYIFKSKILDFYVGKPIVI